MSVARMTSSRGRLTVLSAVVALAGSGMVAANLAGAASGPSALDYAQCQNGAPGSTPSPDCSWINGILNATSTQYHEDQVTAQRLTVSFPDKGAGVKTHSVTLRYLDRKSGIHAYDYLAAANATMADALDLRCNGIVAICPAGPGVSTQTADDPNSVSPTGSGISAVVADHDSGLTADQKKLWLYGATWGTGASSTSGYPANSSPPAMSTPTHDCLSPCTGDDYATTTLSFVTPAGTANHVVQILFGGHLAAGTQIDGWGSGLGAGDVSGGPYHIKWAAADGASVGNRDNQIMSNAIIKIIPQGSTLETTPSTTSANVGDSSLSAVTDSVDMTPASGHAPTGTITFTLYGPLTSPDYNDCTDPATGVTGNVIGTPDTGNALAQKSGSTTVWQASSDAVDMAGLDPGVYQWVADYLHGSDQFNTDEDGTCGDSTERVTISQAPAAGASTQTLTDNVTVSSDAGTPTGTVDWYLYKSLAGCQSDDATNLEDSDVVGDGGDDTNNALDGSGDASSKGMTPDVPAGGHTYYWKVVYSGDTATAGGTVEDCGIQAAALQNAPAAP